MIRPEILERALRQAVGMARCTLVVDENVENLKEHLEKKNCRVHTPTKGWQDDSKEFSKLISSRIFVTANPKDFIDKIPELDVGLISVEHVYQKMPPDLLADKISKVLTKLSLVSKRHGFLVTIKEHDVDYEEFD